MTFNQAVDKIKKNNYLIGKLLAKEEEITNMIIVPSNRKHDKEIILRVRMEKPTIDIIEMHNDFDVIVVCNIEDSIYFVYNLDSVIKKFEKKN